MGFEPGTLGVLTNHVNRYTTEACLINSFSISISKNIYFLHIGFRKLPIYCFFVMKSKVSL